MSEAADKVVLNSGWRRLRQDSQAVELRKLIDARAQLRCRGCQRITRNIAVDISRETDDAVAANQVNLRFGLLSKEALIYLVNLARNGRLLKLRAILHRGAHRIGQINGRRREIN